MGVLSHKYGRLAIAAIDRNRWWTVGTWIADERGLTKPGFFLYAVTAR